ncbi:Protein of unknown function [Gryllus bimaculatus]|nr:Protein of unknown function [Gryllus bimaculatus]
MATAWRVAQRWRRPAESLPPKASVHDGVGVIECDSTWGRAVLDAVQTSLTGICSRPARTSAQRLVLAAMLLFATVLGHAYSGQLLGCLAAGHLPTHGPAFLGGSLPSAQERVHQQQPPRRVRTLRPSRRPARSDRKAENQVVRR